MKNEIKVTDTTFAAVKLEGFLESAKNEKEMKTILNASSRAIKNITSKESENMIKIGFHLALMKSQIQDGMDGYKNFEDYVLNEFGFSRRTAYSYMKIFLEFGERDKTGVYSGKIKSEYKGYGFVALSLLAGLEEKERAQFDKKSTCAQIRDFIKQKKEALEGESCDAIETTAEESESYESTSQTQTFEKKEKEEIGYVVYMDKEGITDLVSLLCNRYVDLCIDKNKIIQKKRITQKDRDAVEKMNAEHFRLNSILDSLEKQVKNNKDTKELSVQIKDVISDSAKTA